MKLDRAQEPSRAVKGKKYATNFKVSGNEILKGKVALFMMDLVLMTLISNIKENMELLLIIAMHGKTQQIYKQEDDFSLILLIYPAENVLLVKIFQLFS